MILYLSMNRMQVPMRERESTVNPMDKKYTNLLLSVIDNLDTIIEVNIRTMVSIIAQTYASLPKLSFAPVFPVEIVILLFIYIIHELKQINTYLGF